MALFEVKNLSFNYPEQREKAIDDFSFTVEKGEFLVLCGPSGCGKSTLLRQLKTVLTPHGIRTGEILFNDVPLESVDAATQAARIGFVSQSPDNQIVTDKVWHELAFGMESLGFDTPAIRGRVAEMASFFGIEDWFYKNVTELSGGQKQLLNLASVMTLQPEVLILDEPTAQLDPIAAGEFLSMLGKINRELGITVILTEHRLEEALPMASAVFVMDHGRVLCHGTPTDVGSALKDKDSRMSLAMPAPMRIWAATANNFDCPITVSAGREWLMNYSKTSSLGAIPKRLLPKQSEETVIEATNLWFRYEKESPDIVRGLNLSIRKGEFFALMGGNGAGKTTTLRLISGSRKPYRGEISVTGKVTALPQNPQALFVAKTLREELYDTLKGSKRSKTSRDESVAYVVSLCRLSSLLDRHPYDLSGGEQQRAALAKVLLTDPDILLLDEPTKGFDAEFKQLFAAIIQNLLVQGITVFMVSHDVEFCAKYAHHCALFFDGSIVTEGTPDKFFSGNSFYTTAANRMARELLPSAITTEDVIVACGGNVPQEVQMPDLIAPIPPPAEDATDFKPKKLPMWRKVIAIIAGAVALGIFFYATGQTDLSKLVMPGSITEAGKQQLWVYVLLIVVLLVCAAATYRKSLPPIYAQTPKEKRKLSKRTICATIIILLFVPFTLYFGVFYLGNQSYYLTALAVLVECMIPFFLIFEGRKPKARELVIIAVLCAMGVAGRAAFFMLQQFKPVAALTIISGVAFGGEVGFLVGAVTMLASNVLFSQGPWTPWQMFAMGIIGFIAGLLFRKGLLRRTKISLAIFGMIVVVLIYGGIMNPASALMWGGKTLNLKIIMSYYITGLPMDLVHAVSTSIFLWFGAEPMLEKMDRIKVKYGLIE